MGRALPPSCQPIRMLNEDVKNDLDKYVGFGSPQINLASCGGSALVSKLAPWLSDFLPGCGDGVLKYYGAVALLYVFDPTDPNVGAIALPSAVPPAHGHSCKLGRRRLARKQCSKFKVTLAAYQNAGATQGSLFEALLRTANRFSTAASNSDSEDTYLQQGVADTYFGLLVQAEQAQAAAGRTLATILRKLRLDLVIRGKKISKIGRKVLTLKHLPGSTLAALAADGFTTDEIKAALRQAFALAGRKGLDLRKALAAPPPTAGFAVQYDSIDLGILAEMVKSLTTQNVIAADGNFALNNDLEDARLACNVGQRIAAVRQFIGDARTMIGGGYAPFVQFAAQPLLTYRPPASNTPPTASFTPSDTSGSVSGGTNTISFTDSSVDPDGGHIACYSWNFGDPSSGASNTSTDPNPDHTYTTPGTYTVTETVSDDDGFGKGSTSQTVTISP